MTFNKYEQSIIEEGEKYLKEQLSKEFSSIICSIIYYDSISEYALGSTNDCNKCKLHNECNRTNVNMGDPFIKYLRSRYE